MKIITFFCLILLSYSGIAQQLASSTAQQPAPVGFTAEQDHQHMMNQLGITRLRPGANGNESAPNAANYDESNANPFSDLPDVLKLKSGKRVTSAQMWWKERRPEIVEDFEREVYGRIPSNTPQVSWKVAISEREYIGWTPVIARKVVGHVDNSAYPFIDVNISMVIVTPANATKPVPLLMMFAPAQFPAPVQPNKDDFEKLNAALRELLAKDPEIKALLDKYPAYNPLVRPQGVSPSGFYLPPSGELPVAHQLINAGWGYALLEPSSIQADNAEGLTKGIIGLVNRGQPRKPDDWGALRAWSWGASRALDYFGTDSTIDAKKVGIEGVSRYGKAALVTMAFDQRFAMGLIGSSGKGGATLHRRYFGEAVENLTGGEYYWLAGNYLKYGAEEGKFGRMNANHLPVDSHQLIALCAPRLTFISYGIPEQGDAKWLDQQGSFMAVVAAGSVFKLLGAKDVGLSNDFTAEKMPPVNTGLLNGHLAWRQHDGGHTDVPNIKHFIEWADKFLGTKTTDSK
jgi:hypothetical protein